MLDGAGTPQDRTDSDHTPTRDTAYPTRDTAYPIRDTAYPIRDTAYPIRTGSRANRSPVHRQPSTCGYVPEGTTRRYE